MKVAVVGAGYVGLTTAAALAWVGHEVTVVEVDAGRLESLASAHVPIYEAHLNEVLTACRDRLAFTASHAEALADADVVLIAVGTPLGSSGAPDLGQLDRAVHQVVSGLGPRDGDLILVVKSTVPVGTGDALAHRVARSRPRRNVHVTSNPEFLRQGRALRDSLYPDRIVLGGPPEALHVLRELYRPIVERSFTPPVGMGAAEHRDPVPVFEVDRRSAELAKYAANAFLAMRISFINEIANVCDRVGADVDAVRSVIGADPRIGKHFLHAGVGYGGSCFPKDTRALGHIATTNGYEFELMSAVIRVNQNQVLRVIDKLEDRLGELREKRIALLGLAFKPGTDDVRGAPSIPLARALAEGGAEVRGHDPQALDNARGHVPAGTRLFTDVAEALEGADALVLVTEWPEYLSLSAAFLRTTMRRPLVIDGRNAYPVSFRHELEYVGFGRAAASPLMED